MTVNNMTRGEARADAVNERVDKMVPKFNDHTKRIQELAVRTQKMERAYAVHINENLKEYNTQATAMDDLILSISAGPMVRRECTVELAELKDKIIGVKEALDDVEAMLYMNVTAELNDDDKPAYTNEPSRKAALCRCRAAAPHLQFLPAHVLSN